MVRKRYQKSKWKLHDELYKRRWAQGESRLQVSTSSYQSHDDADGKREGDSEADRELERVVSMGSTGNFCRVLRTDGNRRASLHSSKPGQET